MEIISRAEWGARAPKSRTALPNIEGIIWHWVGNPGMRQHPTRAEACRTWAGIQAYEMDQKGYVDIAYSYGLDSEGRTYELRGECRQGASNEYNNRTLAVCYLAGPGVAVTDAARRGAAELVAYLKGGHPNISYNWPHSKIRPGGTQCPGDEIRALLPHLFDDIPAAPPAAADAPPDRQEVSTVLLFAVKEDDGKTTFRALNSENVLRTISVGSAFGLASGVPLFDSGNPHPPLGVVGVCTELGCTQFH